MDFKALNAAESNRQSSNKAISEASGKGHGQEKREAVETNALKLHMKALALLNESKHLEAKALFQQLRESPYLTKKTGLTSSVSQTAVKMKYSVLKNLAAIAYSEGDKRSALELYLEASQLGLNDVTLYYRLGVVAVETGQFATARHSFEEGVHLCKEHWPCIMWLCRILFVIQDYPACLTMLEHALATRPHFIEGLCYLKWMYSSNVHLRDVAAPLLRSEDEIDELKYKEVMKEVDRIRSVEIPSGDADYSNTATESPNVTLTIARWVSVGQWMLQLYTWLRTRKLPLSFKLDFTKLIDLPSNTVSDANEEAMEVEQQPSYVSPLKVNQVKEDIKSGMKRRALDFDPEMIPKRRSNRMQHLAFLKLSEAESTGNFLQLLPPNLKNDSWKDLTDLPSLFEVSQVPTEVTNEQECIFPVDSITRQEVSEVDSFVTSLPSLDIIAIMKRFALVLAKRSNLLWFPELGAVFDDVVGRLLEHCQLPVVFGIPGEKEAEEIQEFCDILLCFVENGLSHIKAFIKGRYCQKALSFLNQALPWVTGNEAEPYRILKFLWCRAQECLLREDEDTASDMLEKCLTHMETNLIKEAVIILPNCTSCPLISETCIKERLSHLRKAGTMKKVYASYCNQEYSVVVDHLMGDILNGRLEIKKLLGSPAHASKTWLNMLLVALQRVDDSKSLVTVCIEVMKHHLIKEDIARDSWWKEMRTIFEYLNNFTFEEWYEEQSLLAQLIYSLLKVMDVILEYGEGCTVLRFPYLTPWMIMCKLLDLAPKPTGKGGDAVSSESSEKKDENMLQFLRLSHLQLGKVKLCCHEDGTLIQKYVELLKCFPNHPMYRDELEQCYYCLYGPIVKSPKGKLCPNAVSHGVERVPLTWESALEILQFFQPLLDTVPSSEFVILFKNVMNLVPTGFAEVLEKKVIMSFLGGRVPFISVYCKPSHDLSSLLARAHLVIAEDYYKNSFYKLSASHYIKSLSFSPYNLSGWTGIVHSLIEQVYWTLNCVDTIVSKDTFIFKNLLILVRCFRHCETFGQVDCALLVKMGIALYCITSYMRLISKEDGTRPELLLWAKEAYDTTLLLSVKCFEEINKLNSNAVNRGYANFFLAKIHQKQGSSPLKYLQFFSKASRCFLEDLHDVPKLLDLLSKSLPISALVMSYKYYAAVLKALLKGPSDGDKVQLSEALTVAQLSLLITLESNEHIDKWINSVAEAIIGKIEEIVATERQKGQLCATLGDSLSKGATVIAQGEDISVLACSIMRRRNQVLSAWKQLFPEEKGDDSHSADITVLENLPLICLCLVGLVKCAIKFPNYHKPIYQLAKLFHSLDLNKVSRTFLLGPLPGELIMQQELLAPPITLKPNIFGNLWKLQVKELNRPGSFPLQTKVLAELVVDVLSDLNDLEALVYITQQLKVKPEASKQYLRECDRISVARKITEKAIICFTHVCKDKEGATTAELVPLVKMSQTLKSAVFRLSGISKNLTQELKLVSKSLPSKESISKWKTSQEEQVSITGDCSTEGDGVQE